MTDENSHSRKPTFWSIVVSTLAAAFGVQNKNNHERDFQHNSIWPFIAAGVIFTIGFIVILMLIVRWVLST